MLLNRALFRAPKPGRMLVRRKRQFLSQCRRGKSRHLFYKGVRIENGFSGSGRRSWTGASSCSLIKSWAWATSVTSTGVKAIGLPGSRPGWHRSPSLAAAVALAGNLECTELPTRLCFPFEHHAKRKLTLIWPQRCRLRGHVDNCLNWTGRQVQL